MGLVLPLEEIYKKYDKDELIKKLLIKNKQIETAENYISELETEQKELSKDLKQEKDITQALYKEIKTKNAKIELLQKNFSIERETHQVEIMKKDIEINKLKK